MQTQKAFGANLRRVRNAAGFTQAKLAERINIELRTLQKFEAGEINVPLFNVVRLQRVLHCSWQDLLGEPR